MNILFLGDLVGEGTLPFLKKNLPNILKKYNISFVIVNGENLAEGYGITPNLCDQLFNLGVDVISSGNHIWDQDNIIPYIAKQENLLRPINYSEKSPGKGIGKFTDKLGNKIIVINHFSPFMKSNYAPNFELNNIFMQVIRVGHKTYQHF